MDELIVQNLQMPDTLEDLSKFVLVSIEKVNSIRAEIRAIKKLGLAEEVYKQKVKEAQATAEALMDAQMIIGQLTAKIPTIKNNQYTKVERHPVMTQQKTKKEIVEDMGFNRNQINQFEKMAKNPELVEQAKDEARKANKIVTKKQILGMIDSTNKEKADIAEIDYQLSTPEEIKSELNYDLACMDKVCEIDRLMDMILNNVFDGQYEMDELANIYMERCNNQFDRETVISDLEESITNLQQFRKSLIKYKPIRKVQI